MERLVFLFTLKPVIFGFIGMIISGTCFPLCGVIILRHSLIPLRYVLMHGVILGGIFSLSLSLPLLPTSIIINLLLVALLLVLNKEKSGGLATSGTAMMVFTMGISSLLTHVFHVQAKDTMELLWGSPYTLVSSDLVILSILAVLTISYVYFFFKPLSMIFFDTDIATSMNVNVKAHTTLMVIITALVVSVAMKLLGALLIDALLILPALPAMRNSKSLKTVFVKSSIYGLSLSFISYIISLILNLPPSGALSVISALFFIINTIIHRVKKRII